MKLFDKIKDLFTDEVIEPETPVKKEVIQVEIPAPKAPEKEPVEVKPVPAPKVEEKTVFFDEKDFDDIKNTQVRVEPKRETREAVREAYSNSNYSVPKKEVYGVKKEEIKQHFAPTPIISPVYGVLDRNYKKDDIVDTPKPLPKSNRDITLDDVRNKAYGTLEDELESTLFGKTSILFANKEIEKQDYKDIEEELKSTTDAIDLLRDDVPKEVVDDTPKRTTRKRVSIEEVEEVSLPTENEPQEDIESDNMVNDALNDDYSNDDKLSESDLFNLIDDMYEKGDK